MMLSFRWFYLLATKTTKTEKLKLKTSETQSNHLFPQSFYGLRLWRMDKKVRIYLSTLFLSNLIKHIVHPFMYVCAFSFCLDKCAVRMHFKVGMNWNFTVAILFFFFLPCNVWSKCHNWFFWWNNRNNFWWNNFSALKFHPCKFASRSTSTFESNAHI